MKVVVHFDANSGDDNSDHHHKLSITLPAKWLDEPVDKLKVAFIGAYNKKKTENVLEPTDWKLGIQDKSPFARTPYKKLENDVITRTVLVDRQEVFLFPVKDVKSVSKQSGFLCKNHGCQQYFDPALNTDTSCCHHQSPPIFHDTRKWWSCCPETKVYSFEELMEIPGCITSAHSTEAPPMPTQNTAREAAMQNQKMDNLKLETQDGPAPPPAATPTPITSPPKPKPKAKRNLPEGFGFCKHYGCNKEFCLEANHQNACKFHPQAPIFRYGKQVWPCCNVETFDFDDCMKVEGCAIGPHEAEE